MREQLAAAGKYLGQTARLMVGMPRYDVYVEHQQREHPGLPVMT